MPSGSHVIATQCMHGGDSAWDTAHMYTMTGTTSCLVHTPPLSFCFGIFSCIMEAPWPTLGADQKSDRFTSTKGAEQLRSIPQGPM